MEELAKQQLVVDQVKRLGVVDEDGEDELLVVDETFPIVQKSVDGRLARVVAAEPVLMQGQKLVGAEVKKKPVAKQLLEDLGDRRNDTNRRAELVGSVLEHFGRNVANAG